MSCAGHRRVNPAYRSINLPSTARVSLLGFGEFGEQAGDKFDVQDVILDFDVFIGSVDVGVVVARTRAIDHRNAVAHAKFLHRTRASFTRQDIGP